MIGRPAPQLPDCVRINDLNDGCLKLRPTDICVEIIAPHVDSDQFASAPCVRETTRRIVFALAAFFLFAGMETVRRVVDVLLRQHDRTPLGWSEADRLPAERG